MAPRKRPARQSMLDDALSEALATRIPQKDTGPDPDDILPDGTDEPAGLAVAAADSRTIQVVLDAADREIAERIEHIVLSATGEYIDTAEALRIALKACKLHETDIEAAHADVAARKTE